MERKDNNSLIYEPKSRYRSHHDNFPDEEQENEEIEDELENEAHAEESETEQQSDPIAVISNIVGDQAADVAKNLVKSYIMKNPMVLLALAGAFLLLIIILGAASGGGGAADELGGYNFDDDSFYGYVEEGYFDLSYFQANEGMWWPVGGEKLLELEGTVLAPGHPTHVNITSVFGYRDTPGISGFHGAIDIGGAGGAPYIIAALPGVVISAIDPGVDDCGTLIKIKHDNNLATMYCHLVTGSLQVEVGDQVVKGQYIGIMGNTGRSTGVHLHFVVYHNGKAEDPLNFVSPSNPRPIENIDPESNVEETTPIETEPPVSEEPDLPVSPPRIPDPNVVEQ